jgi:7-cyano-7-deazaguanine reductase
MSNQTNPERDLEGVTLLGNQNTKYLTEYDPTVLEKFKNKHIGSDNIVNLDCFEFSSLCPKTGQPDLATIHISYIPDKYLVESKSLKLYLFSFRNHGDFHEDCIETICQDLVKLLHPKYIEVYGDFNSRGGISILPFSTYAIDEYKDIEKSRKLAVMSDNIKHRPRTN